VITSESLQAQPGDESRHALQYFSIATSLLAAVLAVSSYVAIDLPREARSLARMAMICTGLAAGAIGAIAHEEWTAAESTVRQVAEVATDRTRAINRVVASKAQLVLEPLGFAQADGSKAAAWRVLRYRQFRYFFIGSLISNWGTWLQNTAQMLLAYQFSHSVLTVGLVTCVQFSTPLVCGPWAGVLADRIGARRTLIATQVASVAITAVMAILELSHSLSQPFLFAGAFLVGLMFTFALPAQSALVPALVPDNAADGKAAVVMNSVAYNAGRMLAPACTVLIVLTTASYFCVFALNAATFATFVFVLSRLKMLSAVQQLKKSRVRDGLNVALKDRRILILLLAVAAVTLAEDPVLVLGPGLAGHGFHLSFDYSGYFLCALGAGSVISSILPRRGSTSTRRAAAALGALGISIVAFALAPWMWMSVAAAAGAGLSGVVAGSTAQAMLRQLAGPGRTLQVMGLWTVAWAGSKPFASAIDGLLPSVAGVRATGVIMAIPALLPPLVLILMPEIARRVIHGPTAQVPTESHEPQWNESFTSSTGGRIAA
jgi:MFS family permease